MDLEAFVKWKPELSFSDYELVKVPKISFIRFADNPKKDFTK